MNLINVNLQHQQQLIKKPHLTDRIIKTHHHYQHRNQKPSSNQHQQQLFYLFNIYLWLILTLSFIKLVKLVQFKLFFSTFLFLLSTGLLISVKFKLKFHLSLSLNRFVDSQFKSNHKNWLAKFYFINLAYFNKNFSPNQSFNLYDFLLFIKNYLILNYLTTLSLIKFESISKSTQKIKALFIFSLLLPPGSSSTNITPNTSSSNGQQKTNTNCPDDAQSDQSINFSIEYDENLFNELNMHETLLNLYRSCYKDKYQDYKMTSSFSSSSSTKSSSTCKKKQISTKDILIGLFFYRDKFLFLSNDVLDRIETICLQNSNQMIDYLEKLFLLADYKHQICGNVFRNSIKLSHLNEYVLLSNSSSSSKHLNHYHHNHKAVIKSREAKNLTFSEPNLENFNSKLAQPKQIKKILNNCTLILLNIHLLSYRASCDFDDFIESLNHFDCVSNNFSVKSNCNKCQVS